MKHATTAQILTAYKTLSDEQLLVLTLFAHKHMDHTSFTEPLDLIHEALHRALDGRRNWPLHVDFGLFMAMCMRSIAYAERNRQENKLSCKMSLEDMDAFSLDALPSRRSVEDDLIEEEGLELARWAAAAARDELKGDEDATKVLAGMLDGMSPKQMCESFPMNPKIFDAARHRVMRRIKGAMALH